MEKNFNLNGIGANRNSAVRNVTTVVAISTLAGHLGKRVIFQGPTMPIPLLVASASLAIASAVYRRYKHKSWRK